MRRFVCGMVAMMAMVMACGARTGRDAPPVRAAAEDTFTASADTWLDGATADTNYGSATLLRSGTNDTRRTLLAFDLAAIPAGSTVSAAELRLHHYDLVNGSGNVAVSVYRVLRAWAEGEATWNRATTAEAWGTAGCNNTLSDRSVAPWGTLTATSASAGSYLTVTLTALVQGWVSGTYANAGLLLIADSGAGNYARWTARNGTNPPRLYVAWTAPQPTPTPTGTATATHTPTATPTATATATPVCPAQVRTTQTWGPGVITLDCDVGVAPGVTLTLAAGTELRFTGGHGYRLDVHGVLVAAGTAAQPVTLTATTPLTGAWGALLLRGPAPSSLAYCTALYGAGINDAAGSVLRHTQALTCTRGLATMSATDALSCTFAYNGQGVLLYGDAAPTIRHCNLYGNVWDAFSEQARAVALPGVWWGDAAGPDAARLWDANDDLALGAIDASGWASAPIP